ncbi:unnamed protein product, partial [marine sediment metagenome]
FDAFLKWDNLNQTDPAFMWGVVCGSDGVASGNIIICEKADETTDFGHAETPNPTIILQSADATSPSDFLKQFHDQTDAQFDWGSGDFKIGASAVGDITHFEDGDIAGDADGKSWILHRKSSADGNHYFQIYIDQYGEGEINFDGASIFRKEDGMLSFGRSGSGGIQYFAYDSGNPVIKQNGYITADTSRKFIQWQVSNGTDWFELTREDANILGFDIQMPLKTDDLEVGGSLEISAVADPKYTLLDSGSPADEEIGGISGQYVSGADGSEYSNTSLDYMNDGTRTAGVTVDSNGATIEGNIIFGENSFKLDPDLSTYGKWSGITIAGVSGVTTLAVGDLCYLNADDSRWELVDANLSDGYDKMLGICVLAGADGAVTEMLIYGVIASTLFPTFTVGSPAYMSETAGDITETAPTTTDSAVRVMGHARSATDFLFNPSNDYYTHI